MITYQLRLVPPTWFSFIGNLLLHNRSFFVADKRFIKKRHKRDSLQKHKRRKNERKRHVTSLQKSHRKNGQVPPLFLSVFFIARDRRKKMRSGVLHFLLSPLFSACSAFVVLEERAITCWSSAGVCHCAFVGRGNGGARRLQRRRSKFSGMLFSGTPDILDGRARSLSHTHTRSI